MQTDYTFSDPLKPLVTQALPEASESLAYAGFGVRLFAYLIDSFIKLVFVFILRISVSASLAYDSSHILNAPLLFHFTVLDIALYLASAAYMILFTYLTGSTIGKLLFKLRVVDISGGRVGLFDVTYRETIGRYLSSLLLIGYVYAAFNSKKQGFHDLLAETCVVYSIKPNYVPLPRKSSRREVVNPRVTPDIPLPVQGGPAATVESASAPQAEYKPDNAWPYWDRHKDD